ncbi:MAG TPA: T9SS type A sorting domain-containing protein [Ignavibacteria bacterium]|nr:T9SS type A sorting domain-containing protein [Ignavibacteria bacterium]
MKNFILLIFIVVNFFNVAKARFELQIFNYSTTDFIYVKVYPIGAIFNGYYEYSLNCKYPILDIYNKIYGGDTILPKKIGQTPDIEFNHDFDNVNGGTNKAIGFGKYRVEFYLSEIIGYDTIYSLVDYCEVDYTDYNYPYGNQSLDTLHYFPYHTNDIVFSFYRQDSITYNWNNNLLPQNRLIQIWNQQIRNPIAIKPQNKNGFLSNNSYNNWPINAIDSGAINHLNSNEFYVNVILKDNGLNTKSNQTIYFKNSFLTIKDSVNFTLNSNSSIIFENGGRFRTFETGTPKTITMGENSYIDVKTGASINLNNTLFQTTNSSVKWKGIKLTDSYLDTISNCTFKNTDTCVNLYNSDKCFARTKKIITGSKFEDGVVKLRNVFNALISNDSFYTSDNNLYQLIVSNSVHSNDYSMIECDEEEESSSQFNLNIAGNHFSGGAVQMYLNCLASEQTPFFIFGNVFEGTGSSTGIGLVANKISGDFRYNSFLNDDYITAVNLLQSNLNFYENSTMKSGTNTTLIVNSSSSARLAPLYSGGNYYWYGGYNKLTSTNGHNLYVIGTSSIFLDKGGNCLTLSNSNYKHIKTQLTGSCNSHGISASDNYLSSIPPLYELECNSSSVPLLYQPYRSSCPGSKSEPIDYDIIDRGDGIIDSAAITDGGDFINGDGEDEDMFGQALIMKRSKNYNGSSELLKTIIDEYDTSGFLVSSLDELYSNYQNIDTIFLQSNTDLLYAELKSYLESKISQHENNFSFVDKAYSYYLMCLIKIREYNEAITGYENIMSNHPEPERRLLASWDRSAVTLILNGSGQGNDNLSVENGDEMTFEASFEKTFEKTLKDKPAHSIARSSFKELKSSNEKYYPANNKEKQLELKIIRYNPSSHSELDKKITEDMNFLLGIKNSDNFENKSLVIDNFKLYQNYPNPFNPKTVISYELRVTGFAKLKVYDVLGNEVATLVNEKQSAGSYSMEFDGSGFASGVYFYKLEAGEFAETKRMILLK